MRGLALDKEKRLTAERQEVCNALAHELRNLASRIGFAYRAVNNEIAYLRESWEALIHKHFPEQPDRQRILQELIKVLTAIGRDYPDAELHAEISELIHFQERMTETCLLPSQNEMWFQYNIHPLWVLILSKIDLKPSSRNQVEDLLHALRKSFHIGTDETLRDNLPGLPDEVKKQWADLAYRQINGTSNGEITHYITLLKAIPVDLPRKQYSLNNFLSLKPLLEVMPEIEKVVNHRLAQLKNSS